jgi:hypothetical protein
VRRVASASALTSSGGEANTGDQKGHYHHQHHSQQLQQAHHVSAGSAGGGRGGVISASLG